MDPSYRSHALLLGIVPRSSADVTRALRGYFRGGFVYVSFQSEGKPKTLRGCL